MLQVLPLATEVQLFVCAKSPEAVTLLKVNALLPLLVTVTLCDPLVVLMSWLPKLKLEGDKLTPGAVPVPEMARTN